MASGASPFGQWLTGQARPQMLRVVSQADLKTGHRHVAICGESFYKLTLGLYLALLPQSRAWPLFGLTLLSVVEKTQSVEAWRLNNPSYHI